MHPRFTARSEGLIENRPPAPAPAPSDGLAIALQELYEGVEGFVIPEQEERLIAASQGDPMYGELTYQGTRTLLDRLALGADDVFYDLGSGLGKVVLHAAMSVPLRRCVGYELSATRCRRARSVLLAARRAHELRARRTVFYQQDFLIAPLDDATVVYACSTAFSAELMSLLVERLVRLPGALRFVSLQPIASHPHLRELERFVVQTTWSPVAPAYVYRVTQD